MITTRFTREVGTLVIMRFTNRERYSKALRHLWANPDKYKVECRGKDFGAEIKATHAECGWYIEFRAV